MGDIPRTEANESTYRQRCFNLCPDTVRFECLACDTHFNKHRGHWQTTCGHAFCRECLENKFRFSMRNRKYYPPTCCAITIALSSVKHHLNPDLVTKFFVFDAAAKDRDPTYCHACTEYIMASGYPNGNAACSSCQTTTCRSCKRSAHDGDCVVDAEARAGDEAAVALADKEGWQSCPKCEEVVERNLGCYHMM